jgi:hypothetical protein
MVDTGAVRRWVGYEPATLTDVGWTASFLASVTGFLHVVASTTTDWLPPLLAAVGYFVAIGLVLIVPALRPVLYPLLAVYALGGIVGAVVVQPGPGWLVALDALAQAALLLAAGFLTYGSWWAGDDRRAVRG